MALFATFKYYIHVYDTEHLMIFWPLFQIK